MAHVPPLYGEGGERSETGGEVTLTTNLCTPTHAPPPWPLRGLSLPMKGRDWLFADAEGGEDAAQDLLGVDAAGDAVQSPGCEAHVLGGEL